MVRVARRHFGELVGIGGDTFLAHLDSPPSAASWRPSLLSRMTDESRFRSGPYLDSARRNVADAESAVITAS
jgi:hypothetical protein